MESLVYTLPLKANIRLRPLRKALGMTREELAVELCVSADSIGRWERGTSSVNKSARKLLENLLRRRGISGDKFLVDALPNRPNTLFGKTDARM